MNLGLLIVAVSPLGCVSNWLNWRYLNYFIVRFFYCIGAIIHETSHAFFVILTGAKVTEFSVFSSQPHVTHTKSKLPLLGEALISLAPIIGGMLFLFLINKYLLDNFFIVPQFQFYTWQSLYIIPIKIVSQLNFFSWKSWVMILLYKYWCNDRPFLAGFKKYLANNNPAFLFKLQ
jgi:hypothetical protein